MVMPVILLILIGIFEVGRAYEAWQVITNAAREGARAAVVPNADETAVEGIVRNYMTGGLLPAAGAAEVSVDRSQTITVNGTDVGASLVTIDYPFEFIVLQPVARLVVSGSTAGEAITIRGTSLMRNEAQ